ncbi:MAG: hypothetical protein ABIW79_06315 [Gemmatimonas sp.]
MTLQSAIVDDVQQSATDVGRWLAANQPRMVAAAVLLGLGVLLAFLGRILTVRIINAIERAVPGRAFRTSFGGIARERRVADLLGAVVFWAVLLFFIATAADALGLPLLTSVVASFSLYVPRMFAAVLIVVVGVVIGSLVRGAISAAATGAGSSFGPGLGQLLRIAIVTSAVLIAIGELGVDIAIFTAFFSVALAALLGGFALAFGLGARTAISNIIGSHYLRKTFEIGQSVRIGEVEGVIAELTATAVILNVPDGRMSVPAKQFGEMPATLLIKRDPS